MKLLATQERALAKFTEGNEESAYSAQESIATLRALVTKGLLKDVTRPGPGAMFSPATHFKFKKV